MGLTVTHVTPRGHRILVSQNVLDIAKRIQEGDPTCLWSGDPRMFVQFNYETEKYEVWRRGEDGRDRIISSWLPNDFDARVLKHLSEHDTRHHDLEKRVDEHNARLTKQRMETANEALAEAREFIRRSAKQLHLPGSEDF